ncbi:MAG: pilus assembly protein PilZ, partial [Spirochaetaceae bacterium]|nr:pilus assembly protein PilZ [Spirochaetaceae bacterium]
METNKAQDNLLGKNIFFLYPSAIIQNELIAELAQQEFEVYIVKNHANLRRVLRKHPGSLVFVNLDEGMSEKDWEVYIRGLIGNVDQPEALVGVLSANATDALMRKYINVVKVQCGFIPVHSDIHKSTKQIFDILKAQDAKGRRKYIRATIENETNATVNMPLGGGFINGAIKDISVVGFSCAFPEDPQIEKNSLVQNVQIRLQTTLLKVEAIVFGSRMEGMSKV